MTKIRVLFAETALRDLEDVLLWHSDQGAPGVGERFVAEIVAKVEGLVNHPDQGRVVPEFNQVLLRELIHAPFRIVYRRDPERIRVVRVWRSERLLRLP